MHQQIAQLGQSNEIRCRNYEDADGNPSGGYAHGPGLCVAFQDGPRGKKHDGTLLPANGAFVEDLITAAYQRLAFFEGSKFKHEANHRAMLHLQSAIEALQERAKERAQRGVLGANAL